jgi:hypothetical protein
MMLWTSSSVRHARHRKRVALYRSDSASHFWAVQGKGEGGGRLRTSPAVTFAASLNPKGSDQPNAISGRGAVHGTGLTETSNPLLLPRGSEVDGWVGGSTKFFPLAVEARTPEMQIR